MNSTGTRLPSTTTAEQLGLWPTPMQKAGDRLWIKREDLCGFGFGGTKVRALEPIMAQVRAAGAQVVVSGGRRDSNWLALCCLAATREGLTFHAVIDPGCSVTTSMRMLAAWGARVHEASAPGAVAVNADIVRVAAATGGFAVPRAGATAVGVMGYRSLAEEILAQIPYRPLDVVVGLGSGGLAAGLLIALNSAVSPGDHGALRVFATPTSKTVAEAEAAVRRQLGAAAHTSRVGDHSVRHLHLLPRGQRRGEPASELAARNGVLLDPVFVAPAWQAYLEARGDARAAVLVASGGLPGFVDGLT